MADPEAKLPYLELILHELRTPLNVACGSLAQLPATGASSLSEREQAALERARRACAQLQQLCDQLRDWTVTLGVPRALVGTPLRAALEDAARAADASRGSTLKVALPGDVPADWQVVAPAGQLSRALAALMIAVGRSAPADAAAIQVRATASHGSATLLIGDVDPAPVDPSFDAERMAGVGFVMPFARAIVDAAGGRAWSSHAGGRLLGIGVSLPRL
jgi:K+-sensing histidine kinase KdpD